jgi:membrane-bound lytic murein transglycosylase D
MRPKGSVCVEAVHVDERKDFAKSTGGCALLMKELYAKFGDWLLVVAAYNAGAGGVRKAIRKSGSRDFWALQDYLPQETRNHVKKFIAPITCLKEVAVQPL